MQIQTELKPIYTGDTETDPFAHGDLPEVFVIAFYDPEHGYKYFWGANWKAEASQYLETLPDGIVYFHNGGKFDFFYVMDWFVGPMMIVNGRIIKANTIHGHEFRDSYAIMPFALSAYKKDEMDYNLLKKSKREKNKAKIISYLKGDVVYLHELVTDFIDTFGPQLTIGTTSMKELQKVHTFASLAESQDEELRRDYYYGGRVQCFQKGIVTGNLKVYDVNSMYPFVMRDYLHPIGRPSCTTKKIGKETCFVSAEGINRGAFPVREKQGIRFDIDGRERMPDGTRRIFHVTIHEYNTAIAHGLFEPTRIIRAINFDRRSTFKEFVNKFYDLRVQAKIDNDISRTLFYKFVLNSAYGKFAQNPKNYFDYQITDISEYPKNWTVCNGHDNSKSCPNSHREYVMDDKYIIWSNPSENNTRHNVATAASITGAARSVLMGAIAKAINPIYCDTDSLICEGLKGVQIHGSELGAWKLEESGTLAAIAGKKLYAVFDNEKCVKQANKGVRISAQDIKDICSGETVTFRKDSPSFSWDGTHKFITRRVRMI